MSKKYVHFTLDSENKTEKKVIDYLENEQGHKSLKVLIIDMILEIIGKSK